MRKIPVVSNYNHGHIIGYLMVNDDISDEALAMSNFSWYFFPETKEIAVATIITTPPVNLFKETDGDSTDWQCARCKLWHPTGQMKYSCCPHHPTPTRFKCASELHPDWVRKTND